MGHPRRSWRNLPTSVIARVLPVPATLAAGALVSRWIVQFAPAQFATDLAQPLVVATNWGSYGALLWAVLAATLGAATIFYLRTLNEEPPPRETITACALTLAAGFLWLPLFSSDVYAYAAYGEMARIGMNAYAHLTLHSADPMIAAAQWQWGGAFPACVYGPAFVALASGITTITGAAHVFAALQTLRIVSCVALLACVVLVSRLSRGGRFFALNPVVLWSAIEGHNDTNALAAVLAGFVIARRWKFAGSAIIAAAALFKLPALAASLGYACDALLTRTRALTVASGSIAGVALAAAGLLAVGMTFRTNSLAHGVYQPLASVQALHPLVAAALMLLVLARIHTFKERIDRWGVLALALWPAIPNPYPWYAVWILALAAFCVDTRVRMSAIAVGMAAILRYLPDAAGIPSEPLTLLCGGVALIAFVPLFLRPKHASAFNR